MVAAQVFDEGADFNNLLGVQAHGGLVQNEHRWVANQGLGNAHALLVALGQVGNKPVKDVFNLHQPADFLDMLLPGSLAFFSSYIKYRYSFTVISMYRGGSSGR